MKEKAIPVGNGPGKYGDACTVARESTGAQMCLLIVLGGKEGTGFSAQALDPKYLGSVPEVLESVADQIRSLRK